MPLPDVHASRAVLIGTADYRYLEPLPAVPGHLDALATLLHDPGLWGLPEANCTVVRDPRTLDDLLEPVSRAAAEATLMRSVSGSGA